jgi:hypothetical protein
VRQGAHLNLFPSLFKNAICPSGSQVRLEFQFRVHDYALICLEINIVLANIISHFRENLVKSHLTGSGKDFPYFSFDEFR